MKKIKVGVIGVGNMGRHHTRVYSELEETELVVIADINREQALKISEEYNCNYYQDYETMINKEKLDAVSIAVPSSFHKTIAIKCMNKGINVLIEKPIALTLSDAEEIINVSKEKKVKLMVGHIERFNPVIDKVKKLIETGMFGKPIIISSTRVGVFPKQITDINVLLDLAVHEIDIIGYLFNNNVKHVFSEAIIGEDGREEAAQLLLNYDHNRIGIIQTNWLTPVKKRKISINCTKGYLEADYISQEITSYTLLPKETPKTYSQFLDYKSEEQIIRLKHVEPLKLEILDFYDSIINDKEPFVNGDDGINALKIALAAVESIKQKKRISLDENNKTNNAN
ncbi:MAG: Gfo/Idh/MocA family oxidoreductase [Nanoarchaeota archaeon]|nr:Gfo/Idh/MocA family oxidoreductase [Nanoarchaeota archaeon]